MKIPMGRQGGSVPHWSESNGVSEGERAVLVSEKQAGAG